MTYRRLRKVLVAAAFALVGGLASALPMASPGAQAAPRPTIPPRPTEGKPRPSLCPQRRGQPEVRCPDEARPQLCLRLIGESMPSISMAAYHLAVQNDGRGRAAAVPVALPFQAQLLALSDASFSAPGPWISRVRSDAVEVQFGALDSHATVTATLRFRVLPSVAPGSLLLARAHSLEDATNTGLLSNSAALIVGQSGASAPAALAIEPAAGVAGTHFSASYDGFASNERVGAWYERPDGSAVALETLRADAQGRAIFVVASSSLPVGSYRLVARGQCSQAVAQASFSISGP